MGCSVQPRLPRVEVATVTWELRGQFLLAVESCMESAHTDGSLADLRRIIEGMKPGDLFSDSVEREHVWSLLDATWKTLHPYAVLDHVPLVMDDAQQCANALCASRQWLVQAVDTCNLRLLLAVGVLLTAVPLNARYVLAGVPRNESKLDTLATELSQLLRCIHIDVSSASCIATRSTQLLAGTATPTTKDDMRNVLWGLSDVAEEPPRWPYGKLVQLLCAIDVGAYLELVNRAPDPATAAVLVGALCEDDMASTATHTLMSNWLAVLESVRRFDAPDVTDQADTRRMYLVGCLQRLAQLNESAFVLVAEALGHRPAFCFALGRALANLPPHVARAVGGALDLSKYSQPPECADEFLRGLDESGHPEEVTRALCRGAYRRYAAICRDGISGRDPVTLWPLVTEYSSVISRSLSFEVTSEVELARRVALILHDLERNEVVWARDGGVQLSRFLVHFGRLMLLARAAARSGLTIKDNTIAARLTTFLADGRFRMRYMHNDTSCLAELTALLGEGRQSSPDAQ